jgi:tRNA dimethylallyltransferase
MDKPKILLIGGPTAVGKSSLALKCAKAFNGEIISADCVQVYKHLNIGSAKATKEQLQEVNHYLIDEIKATENFNVNAFKKRASQLITNITAKNKLPIIVGGTGLYMKALLFPYNLGNASKDENIRAKYEKLAKEKGKQYVHNLLKKVDAKSAQKFHYNDVKRVIRALEIYEVSGKTKTEQETKNYESNYDYTLIALTKDRKNLYNDINKRVEKMFKEGLLEEVEYLIKQKKLTKDMQSMSAIGYKEFFDYFEGKKTLEEVKELIKKNTRNYAKRQITWFKTMPKVKFVSTDDGTQEAFEYLKTKFTNK